MSARVVQAGYDALAPRFGEWSARVEGDPWASFVDDLAARLRPGARVLDLGCGNGEKLARLAGRGFELTGVDLSAQQLRLAEGAVPEATFVHADFAELDLMAQLAGMRLRERWTDWDRSPFTSESTRHVSVWEKP